MSNPIKQKNKEVSLKQKIISYWKKFWYFVWEDDSLFSWIVNIIIAFVLIKFVVYPILGLLLATNFPIVAVVSGSMEHAYTPKLDNQGYPQITAEGQLLYYFCESAYPKDKSMIITKDFRDFDSFWKICGEWYEKKGITYDEFKSFPFANGFNKGDIMILHGEKMENLKVGDIIVFIGKTRTDPIIHRVVAIEKRADGYHIQTKGDHNENSSSLIGETDITKDAYIAKAVFKLPYFGWIKIWFTYIITGFKPIH